MLIEIVAASVPAPVTVVHHWDAVTAWASIALAITTGIMAAVTAWMAWNTHAAVKQNNELRDDANKHYEQTRKQDQEHHEDEYRPVLILAPPAGLSATARSNLVSVINASPPRQIFVHCPIRNIGAGPALNVRMSVRKDEVTGFGPSLDLTPIAGGDCLAPPYDHRFALQVFDPNFNDEDVKGVPGSAWVIILEYSDIFDHRFHTLHYKDSGRAWAKPGRGPAPDTTPKQPT